MSNLTINRRVLLCGLGASGLGMTVPALAATPPLVQVFKDPNCGCCGAWIDIMADAGYAMDIREATYDDLMRLKVRSGISEDMASCHTARIDGYVIEGHVPPADIHRLLSERPDAIGLSVPGMPWGSPGMGPASERDAYSVFLIRNDGTTEIFAHYNAA